MASVTFFKTAWHVEISGHLACFRGAVWTNLMVWYVFFKCLKSGHHSLQLFVRLLRRLFAVNLQQCFVD